MKKCVLFAIFLTAISTAIATNPYAQAQADKFDTSNPAAADAINTLYAFDPILVECPPETQPEVDAFGADAFTCFMVPPETQDMVKNFVEAQAKDGSPSLDSWTAWGNIEGIYGDAAIAVYSNGYRAIWSTYGYGMGQLLGVK